MNEELKKMFNSINGGKDIAIILSALTISILLVIKDAFEEIVKERKIKEECLKKGTPVND